MKRSILIAVMVAASAVGLLWAHGQESKCSSDARTIISQVNEYHSTRNDVGFFGTTVGQLSANELLDRDKEMITCAADDPGNRAYYIDAMDKNSSVESERYLRFLLDSGRMSEYRDWEQAKLAEVK